jgi:tetratricopeptide (TPR) repeat protein
LRVIKHSAKIMNNQQQYKKTMTNSDVFVDSSGNIGGRIYNNTYFLGKIVSIPHRLTNNIPHNALSILGRESELSKIIEYLEHNQATILVNGIGGIGKTSVATKFMALYGHEYAHIAWLVVRSSLFETFINDLTLLESLHITDQVEKLIKSQQSNKASEFVFHQLNCLDKTLVVIDNANNLADLVELKPLFDTSVCHFLITSRTRPSEWAIIAIDVLPETEAIHLFRAIHPVPQMPDEKLKKLLSKLFYHTLLIELVAKAVDSAGISFDELYKMIEKEFIHHEELNEDLLSTGKHGDSVIENRKRSKIEEYIWLIFNQVQGLDDKSKDILRGITLLPLATIIERSELKKHLSIFGLEDIVPTLTILVERGWLDKIQESGQKPSYKMHPLIADVVFKHLHVDATFGEKYIEKIASSIDYDNTNPKDNLSKKNENKPFAERLSDLFFKENTKELSKLLDRLSYLEENFSYYDKAAYYSERALQIANNIFNENNPIIAVRQSNLANVYRNLGRYEEASHLLESALASDLKNYGQDHSEVAIKQSNLANVYRSLKRLDEAALLLETALKNDLKSFGLNHPTVSFRQSNLAHVYWSLDRFDEAASLLETALMNDIKNFGENHPNVASRQNNLAWVYNSMGKVSEAKSLWKAAYEYYFLNFGAENSYTLLFKEKAGI